VFLVELGTTVKVRRLQRLADGRVAVDADNPAYRGEQVEADGLKVMGRCVWMMGGVV
jgi:phage repressor protein C with HTH and peptisase S24 domain